MFTVLVSDVKSTVYNNVFLEVREFVYAFTVDQNLNLLLVIK